MTFVPDPRLDALTAKLNLAENVELRIEKFACRKALAQRKKRDRENDSSRETRLDSSDVSAMESPVDVVTFGTLSTQPCQTIVPLVTVVMNAIYNPGFDFTDSITERHLSYYADANDFESEVEQLLTSLAAPTDQRPDASTLWRGISESALDDKTEPPEGFAPISPYVGPTKHLCEWSEIFELQAPALDPQLADDDVKISKHWFLYARKTKVMIVIILVVRKTSGALLDRSESETCD